MPQCVNVVERTVFGANTDCTWPPPGLGNPMQLDLTATPFGIPGGAKAWTTWGDGPISQITCDTNAQICGGQCGGFCGGCSLNNFSSVFTLSVVNPAAFDAALKCAGLSKVRCIRDTCVISPVRCLLPLPQPLLHRAPLSSAAVSERRRGPCAGAGTGAPSASPWVLRCSHLAHAIGTDGYIVGFVQRILRGYHCVPLHEQPLRSRRQRDLEVRLRGGLWPSWRRVMAHRSRRCPRLWSAPRSTEAAYRPFRSSMPPSSRDKMVRLKIDYSTVQYSTERCFPFEKIPN
jgi:hypothetical protein